MPRCSFYPQLLYSQNLFSSRESFNTLLLLYNSKLNLWDLDTAPIFGVSLFLIHPAIIKNVKCINLKTETETLKGSSAQKQAHLLSWCPWRGQATLWCSGCCAEGGGAPHYQPALLHLSWPQAWGWWGESSGSEMQRKRRRKHSFPVALLLCLGTWHSQSVRRKQIFLLST